MPRTFLIFALVLPLAVLMGYMLSDPLMQTNRMVIGGMIGMLALPLILSFHHTALIWSAHACVNAFFVKGQPLLWMVVAAASFCIAIVSRPMAKNITKPLFTKHLALSLIFLAAVVIVTAKLTGGIGFQATGSGVQGGRRYLSVMVAIAGFFALTMQPIPRKTVLRDLSIFCLAPITAAVSNIAYMLGPGFYFLFFLFPVDMALPQAAADLMTGFQGFKRINGFGPASVALASYCLMRWGVRGMLSFSHPWRPMLFVAALGFGLASGFRSNLVICLVLLGIMFLTEGLHKTKYVFGLFAGTVVGLVVLAGFSESLPFSAQRALSFLPIKVSPIVARDAEGSTTWRLEMWTEVIRELPRYFWLGKGCAIDPSDLYFAEESARRGFGSAHDFALQAGDYHSGPLSLIIPFGIWGVIGFFWFCTAGVSAVWNNMKYSEPEYLKINRFLFSLFVTRLIFFIFFFGAFTVDIWIFASIAGVSLCVNRGVRGPAQRPKFEMPKPVRRVQNREMVPV